MLKGEKEGTKQPLQAYIYSAWGACCQLVALHALHNYSALAPDLLMKKYLFPLLLTVAAACVERPQPPPGTLSQAQMVQILADVHVAESKATRFNFRSIDSTSVLYDHYERAIFRKHRVDTATYRRSFDFYLKHTEYMDEIYRAVVDTLAQREKKGKL